MKCRNAQLQLWLVFVALTAGLGLLLCSCIEDPPLKIGFLGGLTGRVADLGVTGRDGVLLAVEEKNQSGGIGGRKVELVVKDDRQDAESAKQAIRELVNEQVIAIIGPMTSSIAVNIQPLIDAARIVTVSPTAKTDQLSGQDDFFLRVTMPLSNNARQLASYVTQKKNLRQFAVIYDLSNRSFTETWFNYFKQALQDNGGQVILAEAFTSQPNTYFLPIAERVLSSQPDGVLFVSNAIDTALMAQQLHKLGNTVPLFSAEWAFTSDLISFGGRAVNGMSSYNSFNVDGQEGPYLAFKNRFINRFGYVPSFATVLAYDAATYLFAGLEKVPSRAGLKEALLGLDSFNGLQSIIKVDRYGDVERKLFLTVVEDSRFKVVE